MTIPHGAVVWLAEPGRYQSAAVGPDGTHDVPYNRDLKLVDRSPVGGPPELASWRPGDGTVRPEVWKKTTLVLRRGPSLSETLTLESRVEFVCEGYVRVYVRHEYRLAGGGSLPVEPFLASPPIAVYHLVRSSPGGAWRRVRPSHPIPVAWEIAAALDPVQPPF